MEKQKHHLPQECIVVKTGCLWEPQGPGESLPPPLVDTDTNKKRIILKNGSQEKADTKYQKYANNCIFYIDSDFWFSIL